MAVETLDSTADKVNSLHSEVEGDEQNGQYLTFPLGDTMYGIDISHVLEVVIYSVNTKITKVPHMPSYTKGVINLRGKVIPVIDLRLRFHLEENAFDGRTCFVVVNIRNVTTGLIVDTVTGVVSIPSSEIDPAPELDETAQSQFIAGMGKTEKEVYILLETEKLLQEKEIQKLKEVGS